MTKTLTPVKTIRCGGIAIADLYNQVQQKGEVGLMAKTVMYNNAFTVAEKPEKHDLVFLTIGNDLGFTEEPYGHEFMTKEFCLEWSTRHLDGQQVIGLCSEEDAPQLFSQDDCLFNKNIWMAMKPVLGFNGDMFVLGIVYDIDDVGSPWLQASHDNGVWPLDTVVVYRLCKL